MGFKFYIPTRTQFCNMGLVGLGTLYCCGMFVCLVMGDAVVYSSTKNMISLLCLWCLPAMFYMYLVKSYDKHIRPGLEP